MKHKNISSDEFLYSNQKMKRTRQQVAYQRLSTKRVVNFACALITANRSSSLTQGFGIPQQKFLSYKPDSRLYSTPSATDKTSQFSLFDDGDNLSLKKSSYKSKVKQSKGFVNNSKTSWKPKVIRTDVSINPQAPYYFTRSDLEPLKLKDLRVLCEERAIPKSGNKAKLKRLLMAWSTQERLKLISAAGSSKDHMLNYFTERVRKSTSAILPPPQELEDTTVTIHSYEEEEDEEEEEDTEEDESSTTVMTSSSLSPSFNALTESLNRNFYTQTAKFSNLEVQQLYQEAKHADQNGDLEKSAHVLQSLLDINPTDGRVIRRLARLAVQRGNVNGALQILREGTLHNPTNGHLWHGLAMMYVKHFDDSDQARTYFEKSIEVDPTMPNAYHAYARLEQSQGNIRKAASLLKLALKRAPDDGKHRLWHALAQLYREAAMYPQATLALNKGLQVSTPWGKSFLYYELAQVCLSEASTSQTKFSTFVDKAREYFRLAIEAQDGKHAQAWLSLAQIEEKTIDNIQQARAIYIEAAEFYQGWKSKKGKKPPSVPGDHWYLLFQSWVNMEQEQVSMEKKGKAQAVVDACLAFSHFCRAFPRDSRVLTDYAKFLQMHRPWDVQRIQSLLEHACITSMHAEPFRVLAEFQFKIKQNIFEARHIFWEATQKLIASNSDSEDRGLTKLLLSWAMFEFSVASDDKLAEEEKSLGIERAIRLLHKALSVIPSRGETLKDTDTNKWHILRAQVLKAMAQVETANGKHLVAEHCIYLAMIELDNLNGNLSSTDRIKAAALTEELKAISSILVKSDSEKS